MAGSLALTFLFKDQDLHEIIKFKKDSNTGKQAADEDDVANQKMERRKSAKGAELDAQVNKIAEPKDRSGENLISKEEYAENVKRFSKEDGAEMQPHEIKGYYVRKVSYTVTSINDFIIKLRRTAVCDKFFINNNLNFSGLKELFEKLFRVARDELEKNEILGG